MPGRAAAWHPPILQGNEQSRKIRTGWRRACTTDSLFLFFYSAKPISEMQRLYPFPSSSLSRERNRAYLCSLPVRLQAEQKNKNRVEGPTSLFLLHFFTALFSLPSLPRKAPPWYTPSLLIYPPRPYTPAT